ncbi:transglutaminase domain-containing protein [Candidatus Peregrinibacteria bacterium]|jgi:hypothetical protein|nr:transglutaminase domain-containing protein [Candidatus Peregrinibacteria bacterium]MBT4147727.1 transglutaminase domain-containing protein [Candidatus Peregrinibacteria bacterium]MBT4366201.1 transglutaminase domain-containing protein [Candidatus Peregrinibacteria bacterium]MBT4455728.1 transglutaminase domain-containing protein [Candidatus Peregrinibacteria bacterium]
MDDHDDWGDGPDRSNETQDFDYWLSEPGSVPEVLPSLAEIAAVSDEVNYDLLDIEENLSPDKEFIDIGYEYEYLRPDLSDEADTVAGYLIEKKPIDIDQRFEDRAKQQTIQRQEEPFIRECGLSDQFKTRAKFTTKNILLEMLQNSEPADSEGTWFGFEFFADGKWRSVVEEIGNYSNSQIEALRIIDNGSGYLPTDMITLGGGKGRDKKKGQRKPGGKFGTGMKVSDQSGLEKIGPNKKQMKITRFSRNWKAVPFLFRDRTAKHETIKVGYRVWYFKDFVKGSLVEYRNVPDEILDEARRMNRYYLPLDPTLKNRVLHENDAGSILRPKEEGKGTVTVLGRHYEYSVRPESPFLFSYDLHQCEIEDQNRHTADTSRIMANIQEIWRNNISIELFIKLFKSAEEEEYRFQEHRMDGIHIHDEDIFREAVRQYYGIEEFNKIYIDDRTSEKNEKVLKRKGFKGVKIGKSRFLRHSIEQTLGLETGDKIAEDNTSGTKLSRSGIDDYREDTLVSCVARAIELAKIIAEGEEASLMVCVTNSDGGQEKIPYQRFLESKDKKNSQVTSFRIELPHAIESSELNYQKLYELFYSCLGAGIEAYINNGTTEYTAKELFAQGSVVFEEKNWWMCPEEPFCINFEIESRRQVSELKELHKESLKLNPNYSPIEVNPFGEIVSADYSESNIYEYGVINRKISKSSPAMLSYNFQKKVTRDSIFDDVSNMMCVTQSKETMIAVIKHAQANPNLYDFPEYHFEPENGELWVQAFEEVFGTETVVDDIDMDHTEYDKYKRTARKSKIKVAKIPQTLAYSLSHAGVKRLSYAVQPESILEPVVTPMQKLLIRIEEYVDNIFTSCLPKGVKMAPIKIRVATSVLNRYGQQVNTGNTYQNPFLSEGEENLALVLTPLLEQKKFYHLIVALIKMKLDYYKNQIETEDFQDFQADVMQEHSERIFADQKFITQMSRFGNQQIEKATLLLEKKLKEKDMPLPPMKGLFNQEETDKLSRKIRSLEDQLKTRRTIRRIVVGAALLVAVVAAWGPGKRFIESQIDKTKNSSNEKPSKKTEGYKRVRHGEWQVNVTVDRDLSMFSDEEVSDESESKDNSLKFITFPEIKGNHYMREIIGNVYTGKGWKEKADAPEFEAQKYTDVLTAVHWQKLSTGQKTATIRTRTSGEIDPDSIQLEKEDKTKIKIDDDDKERVNNGEYRVKVGNHDDIRAITYEVKTPQRWKGIAQNLTQEDYNSLNEKAYEFYTKTTEIDLKSIKFQNSEYPHFSELFDFINYAKGLPQYKRVMAIREYIQSMRYSRTASAAKAFKRFQKGLSPENELVEFLLNSKELDQPGDGDCDVQNTLFAILCRLSGIPARVVTVSTKNNGKIDHALAEVFFPKIGWIELDTMGRTSPQEPRTRPAEASIRDQQEAEKKAVEERRESIRKKLLLEERQCTELL